MFSSPVIWLALAALLLLLVLLGADFDGLLLIGGVTALLLTLLSALLPLPAALQIALYAGLAAGGYGWLRRWSRQRGEARIAPAAGAELAEVIDGFSPSGEGRVRWQGQSWAAQSLDPERSLPAGSRVTVLGREGTRLQVLPQR